MRYGDYPLDAGHGIAGKVDTKHRSARRCWRFYRATRCRTAADRKDDPGEQQRKNDALMRREAKRQARSTRW